MKPEQLVQVAQQALEHAYAPYSKFPVGCAVLYRDGTVIRGVNVENVSFGATNCAERTALFTGVAQGYCKDDVVMLAIAGKTNYFLPPCSICRQVLVELCPLNTPVYLSNQQGEMMKTTLKELVPLAFVDMETNER